MTAGVGLPPARGLTSFLDAHWSAFPAAGLHTPLLHMPLGLHAHPNRITTMPANRYPDSRSSTSDIQATEKNDVNNLLACKCPRCDGDLIRIRRRPIDRLISLFVSVRRFRCVTLGCNWEGNMRKDRYLAGSAPVTDY